MNMDVPFAPVVVTAAQMQAIEARIFSHGMPVAALMEKVAQRITQRIQQRYPLPQFPRAAILVGPGHNGGDALVVARELHHRGYQVQMHQPVSTLKPLTADHARYAQHLGLSFCQNSQDWLAADFIVDGLFGFGLTRPVSGALADLVAVINQSSVPVVSIDLPSGLHTDSGAVLGTAIAARHSYCLGLWKRAFFQTAALPYLGQAELIPFDIPALDQAAILSQSAPIQLITPSLVRQLLPWDRPPAAHKYQVGSLLLICGSQQYPGAALLCARSAQASGVGMLYVAVPQSLRLWVVSQIPEAVVIACPETDTGAIAALPSDIHWERIDAIALGPGLGDSPIVPALLAVDKPLVLDADALNQLAQMPVEATLQARSSPTLLTPHGGEFKRLFPREAERNGDLMNCVRDLASQLHVVLVLKGAKTFIAGPDGCLWINPESTPALARGGSGDVLTGLMGGLLAQHPQPAASSGWITQLAATAVWWHAQAGCFAAQRYSQLSVSPSLLVDTLKDSLAHLRLA
ncbi:NAD(P)H-hydrate dehydratase [Lyngbya confervoides]|uniref:Bifunctional NAD(P)H-hydrate repair enzyme n=1 Tax=Lyngbya confervoides BDU141951 TaxID=1574623 RepID=A0ABD4T3X7_9CYAN|nr:NAD(P)H-hydrate dehydratase [Lyngbya confervoides]MCM1983379.1 NAD(P)H-hydrate dehydratase [Lyngbya confervoides BDU141951]